MTRVCWFVIFNIVYAPLFSQSLVAKADSLPTDYKFYVFKGSDTIYLSDFGSLEREAPMHKFTRVEYDKSSGLVSVEGLTDICCFEILVARSLGNDKLVNIRRFGETQEIEVSAKERYTGLFNITAKFALDDVIIIGRPGTLYWQAAIIPLGKLLVK